ncbi:MAG: GH92 family glycosyl hydrolase, partial [Muribaculaceae bacterium]|nr:GH92 family glycosyl hydrolase [Muribaculaceae bacterium]
TFCYNPSAVFPIYFVARVNRVPSQSGAWKMQPAMTGVEAEWTPDNGTYKIYTDYGRELSGDDIGYWFTFDSVAPGESIELSVGVSFTSVENARRNLNAEQPAKSTFASLRKAASDRWNSDLGAVAVSGGTREQQQVFYTALYHSLIHPSVLSDANGDYPVMENSATARSKHPRYTVFSLWDTYRNVHQLLTLLYPDRQTDMLRSMVDIYKEWGWLPKWELFGRETFTMEGDPATCVIVDSWRKGLKGFDIDAAYDAMVKSATTPGARNAMRPDIDPYAAKGYIPVGAYAGDNSGDNSVSHALEYYVADAALAHLARERGHHTLADSLTRRSLGYRHYYSPEYGTLRPLMPDGSFLTPFSPDNGANFSNATGFHEGSAWNYTFAVPHDVDGLIELNGGTEAFTDKLQHVFDAGLYDPANEPDIAYPYLFSRIPGEEWRTQREVSRILRNHYTTAADGIPGNDDCGTMSAWAVFSMLGLYPDCPGEPYYTLTSPTFDRAELRLPSGSLLITADRPSPDAIYIKEVTLDGKPLESLRIPHSAIASKGHHTLHFTLEERHIPSPLDHVDPRIGTGDHGHVFVGANVPFGMVQLGPTSVPDSWDWCSGYHESDSTVIGFSHTHLSGTGIGDLFDVTIRPVTARPTDLSRKGSADLALRSAEIARPGFYSVPLSSGILAEMTASTRAGLSRYTYPADADRKLVIALGHGGCWDKVPDSQLAADADGTLVGFRRSTGWAKDQTAYFA